MRKTVFAVLCIFVVGLFFGINIDAYANEYDTLNINYDCGDVTYFHSDFIRLF